MIKLSACRRWHQDEAVHKSPEASGRICPNRGHMSGHNWLGTKIFVNLKGP
jgi:hypothetical protein